jgi:hydrogenase expression/formation protein HypC
MCLALPGQIVSITGESLERVGRVRFGSVVREVSLACLPEAQVGDYVLVHVGLAISRLDQAEAERALAAWQQLAGEEEDLPP